jgi:hypothetical protein
LDVRHRHVTVVTEDGERLSALPLASGDASGHELRDYGAPPIDRMRDRALPEGMLSRDGRRPGFLYLAMPDDVDQVDLMIELVSAHDGSPFGRIVIPFLID